MHHVAFNHSSLWYPTTCYGRNAIGIQDKVSNFGGNLNATDADYFAKLLLNNVGRPFWPP
jgi:hypothetical protein